MQNHSEPIGQSLEAFGVRVFEIVKDGRDYVVRSDQLPDVEQFTRKKSLSEKIWESPTSLRKGEGLAQPDGSFDMSLVTYPGSTHKEDENGADASPLKPTHPIACPSCSAHWAGTWTESSPIHYRFRGPKTTLP
jgi:hypothetical protein